MYKKKSIIKSEGHTGYSKDMMPQIIRKMGGAENNDIIDTILKYQLHLKP